MHLKVVVSNAKLVKPLKSFLQDNHLINKQRKIESENGVFQIFTTLEMDQRHEFEQQITNLFKSSHAIDDENPTGFTESFPVVIETYRSNDNRPTLKKPPSIQEAVIEYYSEHNLRYLPELDAFIPKRWVIYQPMVLINSGTFDSPIWQSESATIDLQKLFKFIIDTCFSKDITHLAINKPIDKQDVMRIPMNIFPLYGDFGPEITEQSLHQPSSLDFEKAFWCTAVQNGIVQTWAPMYTMFSRGNIKEKKRLLDNFKGLNSSWVFDLYAGIGYFSLSYLKNGGRLLCWELNPWSVEALRRNCELNKFTYKVNDLTYDENTQIFIFNDTNENTIHTIQKLLSAPKHLNISHINLGLLPSSQQSWNTTKQLLDISTSPTIIHVHENVHVSEIDKLIGNLNDFFPNTRFLSKNLVKTFAPDVWHVVIDIELKLE